MKQVSDHLQVKVDKKIQKAKNKAEVALKSDGGFASVSAVLKRALKRLPSDDTALFSSRAKKTRGPGESHPGSLQSWKDAMMHSNEILLSV